jgi:NADH-quinone oxidoreductase subunit E
VLKEESRVEIARLQKEYPDQQSALLAALALAQQDYGGWLPDRAFDEVAEVMALPATLVASTASFYTMLHCRPVGRFVIQVCRSVSCFLLGSDSLTKYLSRKLGIAPGETTQDGTFTLLEVECLGSCGTAPVMQVGDRLYESLTEVSVDELLVGLAREEQE